MMRPRNLTLKSGAVHFKISCVRRLSPPGLLLLSEALLNPLGPAVAGSAAVGTAIGAVLWQWVLGRNEPGTDRGCVPVLRDAGRRRQADIACYAV